MVTSSAASIWRRFSSSAPHSFARRWLSTGSSFTSTALPRIQQFAAQRMVQGSGDAHLDVGMAEGSRAGKVHHPVVGGSAGELACVLARRALDQNPLRAAEHA